MFLSSHVLTGFDCGRIGMNPYERFVKLRPAAVLKGEILVFNGSCNGTKVSALSDFVVAGQLRRQSHTDQALAGTKTSEALNPEFRFAHQLPESLCAKNNQPQDALREYHTALHI